LRALVSSGVVLSEDQPPAKLYRLNRDHLAAASIEDLATIRGRLVAAMRSHLAGWEVPAWGAWLFGSAARGDGGEDSDVDVLVARPDGVDEDDVVWLDQVERLVADVTAWTGNRCSVVEYGAGEFELLVAGRGRLAAGLRSDALDLTDRRLPNLTASGRTRR
jgi:predicted nucleotidyltransferase